MSQCRLEMIREGKESIPRSCQLCGLFNRCQKFLDQPHPPKPTAEDTVKAQAAEIERLAAELELTKTVLEQVAKRLHIRGRSIIAYGCADDAHIGSDKETPELYAHLGGGK